MMLISNITNTVIELSPTKKFGQQWRIPPPPPPPTFTTTDNRRFGRLLVANWSHTSTQIYASIWRPENRLKFPIWEDYFFICFLHLPNFCYWNSHGTASVSFDFETVPMRQWKTRQWRKQHIELIVAKTIFTRDYLAARSKHVELWRSIHFATEQ